MYSKFIDSRDRLKEILTENARSIGQVGAALGLAALSAVGLVHEIQTEDEPRQYTLSSGTEKVSFTVGEIRSVGKHDVEVKAISFVEVYESDNQKVLIQDAVNDMPLVGILVPEPAKNKVGIEANTVIHFENCESAEISIFSGAPFDEMLGEQPIEKLPFVGAIPEKELNIGARKFLLNENEMLHCASGVIDPPVFDYPAGTAGLPESYQILLPRK